MGRSVAAVLVALTALGMLAMTQRPEPIPGAAVPATDCHWQDEYDRTLAALGEDGSAWTVEPIDNYWWGMTWSDGTVSIAPYVSCDRVHTTVMHEWMHLQAQRAGISEDDLTGRHEIIADCGVRLLGGSYTPYIDPGHSSYIADCTDNDNEWAAWLIAFSRDLGA